MKISTDIPVPDTTAKIVVQYVVRLAYSDGDTKDAFFFDTREQAEVQIAELRRRKLLR
jgi:hypothetical protein